MYDYLELLNPQQRAAVEYCDGPSLVIAGAGSGKTRVLTYKIVHLIRTGIEPWRILALTFTNKAANEMKERVVQLLGPEIGNRVWMGTFHSVFLRILRRHADKIGYPQNFTIYDAGDSRSLVKMIVKELGLDEKHYKAATVASAISNAKNQLVTPQQYQRQPDRYEADRKANRPMIGRIFELYNERCRIAGAMDFDDILFNMNLLLRDFPEIAEQYQEFFRYILVDEYQDTNFAQHLIVSQLAKKRHRLCVVGDDAQSIYSFRGADIGNILSLEKRLPDLRIFKLERNYRSSQNIINAAGSLIEKNTRQMPKKVYSEKEEGEKVNVIKTLTDLEEAYFVSNYLVQMKHSHQDAYDNFAILYRTNAQSRVLEEALRKKAIPYRIYGGLSFYQRKEIKDAICYFRLTVNPSDDEALRRIVNYPARGIGDTTMGKIAQCATEGKVSMWEVICNPGKYNLKVNSGTLKKLDAFRDMIQTFIDDNRKSDAFELGQLIINRTGLLTALAHDNTPESISKQENLSELLSGLKEFVDMRRETGDGSVTMTDFLSEVSLATDQDEEDNKDEAKVTLMTVHAAKGLEFKHVIIVGVEEELFPSAMAMTSLADIEEERRLLYVAITRAMQTCTITYANSRFRNGTTVFSRPSRFIGDIDRKYLRLDNSGDIHFGASVGMVNSVNQYNSFYGQGERRAPEPGTSYSDRLRTTGRAREKKHFLPFDASSAVEVEATPDGSIRIGTKIEHSRFGRGIVRKIETVSGDAVITVDFGHIGIKKLILKFAKIKILE